MQLPIIEAMNRGIPTILTFVLLFGLGAGIADEAIAGSKKGDCKNGPCKSPGSGKKKAAPAPGPKKGKAPPPAEPEPPPAAPASDLVPNAAFRGPTRIDFDDRLIQGQTNKSGAVYLFDRKETGIDSMVHRRKSFKALTIATIYDR